MTEFTSKHRGKPALDFLREANLYARLDAATESGEINDILESAKHLVALLKHGENETYWKRELKVVPDDLSLLNTVMTAIDEDRLDQAGKKALKVLSATIINLTLPLVGRHFNERPAPKIPLNSIYSGKNPAAANVIDGEPPEFGVYPAGQSFDSVVTVFANTHKDFLIKRLNYPDVYAKHPDPVTETPITAMDLQGLSFDAISGNYKIFNKSPVQLIMRSPKAFSEVTKKEFATAYLKAAEQPMALGMFALVAISKRLSDLRKKTPDGVEELYPLTGKFYGLESSNRGNFLFSAQEFRENEFATNPFTVDEIKALPFLMGMHEEVYAEVEHNHAIHAPACAAKLKSAGFEKLADFIQENHAVKTAKPARKYDTDLSPGM